MKLRDFVFVASCASLSQGCDLLKDEEPTVEMKMSELIIMRTEASQAVTELLKGDRQHDALTDCEQIFQDCHTKNATTGKKPAADADRDYKQCMVNQISCLRDKLR